MKVHGIKERVWATFFRAKFDTGTKVQTRLAHKKLIAG